MGVLHRDRSIKKNFILVLQSKFLRSYAGRLYLNDEMSIEEVSVRTFLSRLVLTAASLGSLSLVVASAASASASWDGTWTGTLYNRPVSVSISDGKVISYTIGGSAYDVQYSRVTLRGVSFGDRDNYAVSLVRTGDDTASEMVHGRNGYRNAALTKQ
jgi:hypothetical protein